MLIERAQLLAERIENAANSWQKAGCVDGTRWPEERFQEVIRETRRSGISFDIILRSELSRTFFGPKHQQEIVDLLAMKAKDATWGCPCYDDFWRFPLSHQARAALGDRLALIGDQRHGVGLSDDGLPDINWCWLAGGEVTIEAAPLDYGPELWVKNAVTRWLRFGANRSGRPEKYRRVVPPFYMSRYPITVKQFAAFVKNCHDGGRWRLPPGFPAGHLERDPPEHSARHDNQPADSVSWYDAIAFSHWLSARLGKDVRLPTEFEWQFAATGGKRVNAYPWGPDWDLERANTCESGLDRTTAVGMYPSGASEAGVLDLAGTVWEWCLNAYERPADTTVGVEDKSFRVLRGGSWFYERDFARCTFRGWDHPDDRTTNIGFRVVCSSPIESRRSPQPGRWW